MESTDKKGGRPTGRIKTAKIEVKLDPSIKEDFMTQMRIEGKTASVEVGEWIKNYLSKKKDEVENV